MEQYTSGTGQKLEVHDKADCKGHCPIHNPSDHHMREWKTHWRGDIHMWERICEHGVGHPDPDDYSIRTGKDDGLHGCDGCCRDTRGCNSE